MKIAALWRAYWAAAILTSLFSGWKWWSVSSEIKALVRQENEYRLMGSLPDQSESDKQANDFWVNHYISEELKLFLILNKWRDRSIVTPPLSLFAAYLFFWIFTGRALRPKQIWLAVLGSNQGHSR